MTVDTERFRTALLEERGRVENAIANLRDDHPGRLDEEVEEIGGASDNHLAETATATLDREIDYTLEEHSTQVLVEIDAALERIEAGTYGVCTSCATGDSRRPARGVSVGVALHRLQARARAPVSEPARPLDVRVGSSTDALSPVSTAKRSLAAGTAQWLALAAIALAAVAADQLTKHIVTGNLQLGEGTHVLGPLWIHHVQNSGIAFGFFASATAVVIVLTGVAVAWMLGYLRPLRSPPPDPAGRARPRDRRQPLESARPRAPRLRHRLSRSPLLAGVQPRRQLHRDRGRPTARRARRGRARAAQVAARA